MIRKEGNNCKRDRLFTSRIRTRDVSLFIRREDAKLTRICDCCKKHKGYSIFYHWKGVLTKAYLGLICGHCACREEFGSNYKRNKRYIKWKEKNNA